MLHPARLHESKEILKIGLTEKYFKDLCLFKAFKKTRLYIDKYLYKKAKYESLKLIEAKKQAFFDGKLLERFGKPK